MIFYTIMDKQGTTFDCTTSLRQAKQIANDSGQFCIVTRESVNVNAETIKRLLGNHGGYCTDSKEVYVSPEK